MTDGVLRVCRAYRRAMQKGDDLSEFIGRIAIREGVQRGAIWKRLRRGGLVPEYRLGVILHRRKKDIGPPPQRVERDPCFRCGVRADIGCRHVHH